MAKKALINTKEPSGLNGYRVVEVVNLGNEFEIHSDLQWKDCDDSVVADCNWFDPATNTFKKFESHPDVIFPTEPLATDVEGNEIEEYVWNLNTESYNKVQIINN